jgi:TetR/AcrR family transcriptional regulator, lmrAB and yxaGH operons repressor
MPDMNDQEALKVSARDRLISSAAGLFQRRGFHGIGLIELLETSGAPRGSFYYHFPEGKEQLADVAILKAGGDVTAMINWAFADAASFSDGAKRLASKIGERFERSGFADGCPVTSVMLETVPESPRLAITCKAIFQDWIDAVAEHAKRFDHGEQAGDMAIGLVIALEGAWIVARAQSSVRPFEVATKFLF